MIIDMHVHTNRSDGLYPPKLVLKVAYLKGLNGIAITDHDVSPPKIKYRNLLVVPGVEVSTDKGHILLIGAHKAPKKGISIPELIDLAKENAWLVIPAHPFDTIRKGIGEEVFKHKFDGIEVANCATISMKLNYKARKVAESLNLPKLGGSDAHCLELIGTCYTVFKYHIEDLDDLYQAIRAGDVDGVGCTPKIAVLKCLNKILRRKFINFIRARIKGEFYNFYKV